MFLLNMTHVIVLLILVNEMSTIDLCNEDDSMEVTSYFSKNVTATQCGCERTRCIRKCCKAGFLLKKQFCVKNDSNDAFKLSVYMNKTVLVSELARNEHFLVGIMNCNRYFRLNILDPRENFYVQEDGTMWVPYYGRFYSNDAYCVDELHGMTALLCFPEEPNLEQQLIAQFDVVGMIISMPFLLATFLVYAILPDSNLHRKALMCYVFTLLLAYIFLVTVQLHNGKFPDAICQLLGYSVIFFFMVSFFWMNVMCIDMWLAFSGLRGFGKRNTERKRFILYCIYAWGIPVLHVIVVWAINNYGEKSDYYPGVGDTKCFLEDGIPNLLYFYGPMAVLITINIILFILTAVKIQKVKKETSMLKHSDSKRHAYEDDKQKFNLYLKLLFAMGINWTMEIISWAVNWKLGPNVPASVWYLTDFCNAMYGAFIFFIFVFKKKIWKSLQKRYYVFIGKPHLAHSMTTTQTTRSSNYSTTETGLSDHRLSELRNGRGEERALAQH